MNDSKEEITVISEEAEIALEDGEIEEEIEETVVEPISAIVCDEAVVDADNDSDVENCDRLSVKPKKHKHHHKGVHRKRLLSTDGGSTTDSWKRARSDDEFAESKPFEKLNDSPLFDNDNVNMETERVEKCTWKHDSDEDDFVSKSSNKFVNEETFSSEKRKERSFDDDDTNKNVDKHKDSFCDSPVVKESWGADSDEDCTKPSQGGNSNWVNNDTKDDVSNDWGNKNDEKKSWNNDNDDKGWGNKNDDNSSWSKKNDDNIKGWGNRNDNNRGWGNRNEGNRSRGNRNDNNRGWGNRDDNNSNGDNNDDNKGDWGNRNEGNRGWGNRNDDNSGYGNRRGGRNNWGNRNDDGNNRGFRGRGRNNWRNRNDDNNSWTNKNDDNNSWSNKNDDNNSWSNKNRGNNDNDNNNRDSNDWSNKNSESNAWSSKGRDSNDWGNKGNDDCNDTNRNENDDWKKSSNDTDDRAKSEEKEVVEKQAWGYDSDNEDTPATQKTTCVSKEKSPNFFNESNRNRNDTFGDEDRNNTSSYNDEKCNQDVSSNEPVKVRDIDDFGKWGGFDSDEEEKKPKEVATTSQSHFNNDNQDKTFDKPANKGSPENSAKWDYDSDEANNPKPQPQRSFNNDNNDSGFDNSPNKNKSSGFSKWGDVNSDDEGKSTHRDQNNDEDDKGGFGNYGKRSFDNNRNNRNDNFNNRNDNFNRNNNNRNDNFNRNDNNRGGFNRNDNRNGGGGGGGKKWPCKYFQMGSCRHGDNCSFLHDSPVKTQSQSQSQEPKIQELCRFYEHQECYKRNACAYMHEEFPCKLFHAGSKMCPSGDSCKYSHSPLTPETRAMLGKYLDEKIDERTDKSTSGSIHDNSDYKANNITPCPEDMIDPYFQDPMQHMYPQGPDPMNFPIRPWNPMMPYGDMPMPHAMEYMQRQRFMMDRYPQSMPGRMMPRGFRGMMGNASHGGPMNDPYNSNPYAVTPLMPPGYGGGPMKDRMGGGMPDPYIDNLAQLVVGKDARPVKLDPLDDMDDYEGLGGQRRRALSPLKINSPEIPPGAYVPRNSMNAVQPNVRLGGVPCGGGDAALMGGYGVGYGGGAGAGHPGADSAAMMDYINMAAIHYYHNQGGAGGLDHLGGFERPWKLLLLEVPVKVPYPLMQIDTGDLPHRQIDPRLRGHPSVLATGGGGGGQAPEDPSDTMAQSAQLTSQLSSPLPGSTDSSDIERQLSASYQYRSGQESPVFPLSEEAFNSFLGGPDDAAKRTLDRSYLQDPRFKRKKAVTAVTPEHLADSLD